MLYFYTETVDFSQSSDFALPGNLVPRAFPLKKWVGREKALTLAGLRKDVPAFWCHIQNMSNASELRQAVID